MATRLRTLGVRGKSLPTKKSKTVAPADFAIGGILGLFERRYARSYLCNNSEEFKEIFGDHINSSWYGWDAVKGFFDNIVGTDGKLYVVGHVGYTGSAIDAVVATANIADQAGSPQNTIRADAAYQEELEYGESGNRTGYTIENGDRFSTECKTANTASDTFVDLDSVADVKVGDIMKFVATGGGGATVHKKITVVSETSGRVSFTGAFDATANMEIGDAATVIGFKVRTWRKTLNGVVTEVEETLGKNWCTMEPEVTDYYVQNVHAANKWMKLTDLNVTETNIEEAFPANVTTVTYLASGSYGTSPTTVAHWSNSLTYFDNDPIRMLSNPETTDIDIQKAIETYSRARWDNPKVIYNIASDRTKAQLITIGNNYQRSDDVLGVIVANWLEIEDPFASSTIAPPRDIPNVGHVQGAWIRVIGTFGVHYIPAIADIPIFGIKGLTSTTIFDDDDRTDIAEAGINLIQFRQGIGYQIRNFFTPSTTLEFQFANGILMREFIKVSGVDSLTSSENQPNNFERIKADKMAMLQFLQRLWDVGSTGQVPRGETFGQTIDAEGVPTDFEDHVQVQADLVNNPQSSINAGERNIDVWFSYPAPAGSIEIGVGLLLLS